MLTFALWIGTAETTNAEVIIIRYSQYHILPSDTCQWVGKEPYVKYYYREDENSV